MAVWVARGFSAFAVPESLLSQSIGVTPIGLTTLRISGAGPMPHQNLYVGTITLVDVLNITLG